LSHLAQQSAAPAFKVTSLLKESLTRQPDKEVVMVLIERPPGAGTGRHTHPGDEYATILEGKKAPTPERSIQVSRITTKPALCMKRKIRGINLRRQ
jgi:hypothetical protein